VNIRHLPFNTALVEYERQAEHLLNACRAADRDAIRLFNEKHPRFLDAKIPWLPKHVTAAEIVGALLDLNDARLAIARWYDFSDWEALAAFVGQATKPGSAVALFESAVDAVVGGDVDTLQSLLREHPELIQARSTRITHFDPPLHRATLLHYVAANGVEGYRQKTPKNAVEIARTLLSAGADPDSLADLYGQGCTTMSLLVSSSHPADAGLQPALVDVLVDFGASVEAVGSTKWAAPLMTALAFSYRDAAEALVRRGAQITTLDAAAGLGRDDKAALLLPSADPETRHRALALAAQLGHTAIVKLLLNAGESPNRYNPDGLHAHSTPLHQASLAGHLSVVQLLVENGARLDLKDQIYQSTPLGWAIHGGQTAVEAYLRSQSAP